ncbi:hypothetical protein [Actinomycetospora straminea]|uniref:Secreted protein n=1 Tax=Actinomycetospora straminea TaxID=663607 RepID=A0ABP9E5S4_9PSEU|nr:hypothetical protein [Actinomycetospora straminea]MDD7931384.1 hypothetical protein [Actinomycetospora straminea]
MDWAVLGPAVFSLVGVAVGALGSFGGVLITQRTTKQQAAVQLAAARRTEKKDAILAYLDVVEDSWVLMDGLWGRRPLVSKAGEPLDDAADVEREKHRRNNDVWHHQNRLNLVTPEPVRTAARTLTQRIYEATYHADQVETVLWKHVSPAEAEFLEAARKDLGVEELGDVSRDRE